MGYTVALSLALQAAAALNKANNWNLKFWVNYVVSHGRFQDYSNPA